MMVTRRTLIAAGATMGAATLARGAHAEPNGGQAPISAMRPWRRIATEEAFWPPAVAEAQRAFGLSNWGSLDLQYTRVTCDPKTDLYRGLTDFEERLRVMDRDGVAMHVLSLTAPGVQMFDPDTGATFATLSNNFLAEVIARHPTRFAGLACLAPQAPVQAVKEMERAIKQLKLNGFIINSHTNGEYLDNQKYWPILEAAEAMDMPIYLHPRAPCDSMAGPFKDYGFESARWGFQVETATHVLRMIAGNVFDRFPKLTIVLGHMGEGLFGNLWRIDHTSAPGRLRWVNSKSPELLPSEVLKRNFYVTTSGVLDEHLIKFVINLFGVDRMMYAIDYPFQESAPSVAFMNSANIADADKEKLFHTNAERVFRLSTGTRGGSSEIS